MDFASQRIELSNRSASHGNFTFERRDEGVTRPQGRILRLRRTWRFAIQWTNIYRRNA